MRAANSSARSPANTRWVWLSTKPGITHRPAASIARSAAGGAPRRRPRHARRRSPARRREHAAAPVAERRVVRVEAGDAVDDGGRHVALHTSAIERSSAATTSSAPVGAVAHDVLAADDDVAHVGRRRREHDAAARCRSRSCAGEADAVEADRHEVGEAAGERSSPPSPAEGDGSRSSSPRRATTPTGLGPAPSRRAAARRARRRAPPRTGRSPRASPIRGTASPRAKRRGRSDPVGEVALGRRADAAARRGRSASSPTSRDVTCVAWTAENRSSRPGVARTAARRACSRTRPRQSVVLLRLLGHVGVEHGAVLARPRRRRSAIACGSTARTEWMAAPSRAAGRLRRRRAPSTRSAHACGRAVAEAPLHGRSAATPKPPSQVAGVEQRDAQAGRVGGAEQPPAHLVGVGVRHARRAGGGGSGTRRRRCSRRGPSRRTPRSPGVRRCRDRASRRARTSARATSRTCPPPCVRPRRARWKAWLWALAKPGRVRPAQARWRRPVATATPVATAVIMSAVDGDDARRRGGAVDRPEPGLLAPERRGRGRHRVRSRHARRSG